MDVNKNYSEFKKILNELELVFEEQDNKFIVPFSTDDGNGDYSTDLIINIDEEYFIIESAFPTNVPMERLSEVSIYLHLINARLKMGKFIIDLKSGKVAFSSAGLFETTKSQVWKTIGLVLNMAEQQIKPVYSVGFGEKDPIDVYEEFFSQVFHKETVEN